MNEATNDDLEQNDQTQADSEDMNSSETENEFTCNEIRKAYRNIREDMIENRLEFINPNSNLLEKTLEKVEKTFKSVKKPREGVSDSTVMLELTILAKERIRNVHCAFRSFNNCDFMEKLKSFMASKNQNHNQTNRENYMEANDEDDETESNSLRNNTRSGGGARNYVLTKPILTKFGSYSMSYFRILPRPKFLLGSLEKELTLTKNKVTRQRKNANQDLESTRTKIKVLDANSKENEVNNTVSETERIHKILTKTYKRFKDPICLYEFIINPNSFSRTIENIFYTSFLVKDGYAKIYLDADNLPVIEPCEKTKTNENTAKNFSTNIQSMISLNKIEWKEIIEVFGIKTAIIPDLNG